MIQPRLPQAGFPKASRLLNRRDFQFPAFKRVQTECFSFVYNDEGTGRLGISISKKVLKRATARNRVRRLFRETFRLSPELRDGVDLHVVGRGPLTGQWRELDRDKVAALLDSLVRKLSRGQRAKVG